MVEKWIDIYPFILTNIANKLLKILIFLILNIFTINSFLCFGFLLDKLCDLGRTILPKLFVVRDAFLFMLRPSCFLAIFRAVLSFFAFAADEFIGFCANYTKWFGFLLIFEFWVHLLYFFLYY